MIPQADGADFKHMMAHVRRGDARAVKRHVEQGGKMLVFTEFEWLTKTPKEIKGNPLVRSENGPSKQ